MLDSNVLAGVLVATGRGDGGGTISRVVRVGLRGAYVRLLPQALVGEFPRVVTAVPHVVARTVIDAAWAFVASLGATAAERPNLAPSA